MSDRDELVRVIAKPRMHTNESLGKARAIADAILAAGYRKVDPAAETRTEKVEAALDQAKRDHEENLRAGLRHKHRADEAEAVLDRVREALAGHPDCDEHPDDDPITCGWKHAVADARAALRGDS